MNRPFHSRPLGLALVGAVLAGVSFSSHAFFNLSSCPGPHGALRIVEPDDGLGAWATYGLPAPTRMLRVMVNESKCFVVLDRGVGFEAAQAERALAQAGHLQENPNLAGGQMIGADYVLIPDIVSQNANAGGSNMGGAASGGAKRGLFGSVLNVATLGVSGKMTTKKQTAEVVLTLVDVRTSQQIATVSGEAKISDKAWSAAVAASNAQGTAAANFGRWQNTEIGKVILEAYEEAYSRLVKQMRFSNVQVSGRSGLAAALMPSARMPAAPQPAHAPAALPAQVAPQQVEAAPPPVVEARKPMASAPTAGATLVLGRIPRLLAQPSSQADVVAELKEGMLLFPTGNTEGALLEVEDEMGKRGWVPAAAVQEAV